MISKRALADSDIGHVRIVMIVLATAIFAGAASMRILDALLPEIASDYGKSIGTTGAAVTAYAVSYSGCQLLYGPLGDRIGPYRIVTLAAFLAGLAALGCTLAPSFDWLVALRFLAGGLSAGIGPLTIAWISHATTARHRPIAIARMTGASIIGTTAGQIGGGLIGQFFTWRACFLIIALLFGISAWALASTGARHPRLRLIGRRVDENGAGHPGLRSLLCRPGLRFTIIAVGIEGLAMYMSFTYVAALLKGRLSLSVAAIGLVIALFGVGGISFVLLARRFVENITERYRAVLGGSLLFVGFGMLMLVSSRLIAGCAMFVLGLGFFMLHNILQVRTITMAPDAPGTAMSLFAATFFLAQAMGATVGGWSFDHLGPSVSCGASAVILAGLGVTVGRMANKPGLRPSPPMA
jgi:predicted MFS family arabinose efflux permease